LKGLLRHFDGHDAARFLALFWLLVICTYLGLILVRDMEAGDRLFLRDYYCFYRAGQLAVEGGTGYEDPDRTFANPPFTLPLFEALSFAGPDGSYWVCLVLGTVLTVLGMLALARVPGLDPRYRLTMTMTGLACPSLVFALHLGQLTPLYLLFACLVVYGWAAERDVLAGVAAGLLWSKPPLAVALVAIGTLTRPRAFTLAWTATLALLLALSVPFGVEGWHGFKASLDTLVSRHELNPDSWRKQETLYAFLRTVVWKLEGSPAERPEHGRELARGLVIALSAIFGAWGLALRIQARRDWHLPEHRVERMVRLGSIAMLATIALNLYLFYYDSALVILPTLFLFTLELQWRSRARWWLAVVLSMAIWIAQMLPMLWNDGPNPIGPLALVWLALELVELGAIPATPTPPRARSDESESAAGDETERAVGAGEAAA
jgi:hypothetical protein